MESLHARKFTQVPPEFWFQTLCPLQWHFLFFSRALLLLLVTLQCRLSEAGCGWSKAWHNSVKHSSFWGNLLFPLSQNVGNERNTKKSERFNAGGWWMYIIRVCLHLETETDNCAAEGASFFSCNATRCRLTLPLEETPAGFVAPADSGGPGGPGSPCPQNLVKIMQFSGNFKGNPIFWANFGLRAPVGSKLRWAPLTKILDPPLCCIVCNAVFAETKAKSRNEEQNIFPALHRFSFPHPLELFQEEPGKDKWPWQERHHTCTSCVVCWMT